MTCLEAAATFKPVLTKETFSIKIFTQSDIKLAAALLELWGCFEVTDWETLCEPHCEAYRVYY